MAHLAKSTALVAFFGLWFTLAPIPALAQPTAPDPATTLAQRYAPVVRLVDHPDKCGRHGEQYQPTNVNAVLGNPEVALRGPWDSTNIVTVGPTAQDLSAGLPGYNLDFPGEALSPGCTYADWAAQIAETSPPTVYAHVATEPGFPDQLALQYWFFYVFNDFNDLHEGDWEMIQLNFHAADVTQALTTSPYETGYSQHEGGERAAWGDPKLQIVDGTHPVVYPALGSHANYYSDALYLGRSAAQGVGCDDTVGPSRQLRPTVINIPQAPAQYLKEFPWLGYLGRWGERHKSVDNGPTGPNAKERWTAPFTWTDNNWRPESFEVPEGGRLGNLATGFFCSAVAAGSNVFNAAIDNTPRLLLILALLLALFIWLATRTRWGPSLPFRVRRRRPWGALITTAGRLYASHMRLILGIGSLFIVVGLITVGIQYLLFTVGPFAALVQRAGESNSFVATVVAGLGVVLTLLSLTLVQAATTVAILELDAGREITATAAYGTALRQVRPLLRSLLIVTLIVTVLTLTVIGIVVAAWLVVRWSLFAQVAIVEKNPMSRPLRRSAQLTRRHWWRTASLTLLVTGGALLIGPLVGVLMLFATGASFNVVNLVAAVIAVAVMPFTAIATCYLYFDLAVRERLAEQEAGPARVLPAEG